MGREGASESQIDQGPRSQKHTQSGEMMNLHFIEWEICSLSQVKTLLGGNPKLALPLCLSSAQLACVNVYRPEFNT
eukprot:763516-Hanusia_phi.AAC.2